MFQPMISIWASAAAEPNKSSAIIAIRFIAL
jgi:hypothetical protein